MTKSKEEISRDSYAYFLEKGAPFVTARRVDASFLDRYQALAPAPLLELWRTHGLGMTHQGLACICDPADYAPILDTILRGDPEIRPAESLVYAYTAFGKLLVWNARWQDVRINLPVRRIVPFQATSPPPDEDRNLALTSALATISLATADHRDGSEKPLFERAVKKLGPLEFDEVYGFFPALALGGTPALSHLRRVKAPEHFSILAQIGSFTIIDASKRPPRPLRTAGPR